MTYDPEGFWILNPDVPQPQYDTYGAIAVSPSTRYWATVGALRDRDTANSQALWKLNEQIRGFGKQDARIAICAVNSYLALAVDEFQNFSWASGSDREKLKAAVVSYAQTLGTKCKIVALFHSSVVPPY